MPFWTLILLAGRTAIPQDLYDAAAIDGASGFQRFVHLVGLSRCWRTCISPCTLLSSLWMIGDFVTPEMVSSGAPDGSTDVLATLGVDSLLEAGKPALGVASAMSALPLLIPLAVALMRTLRTREVQL